MAEGSEKKTGEPQPILGKLLMDFFYLFGEDFNPREEGFSVHGGGFRFLCNGDPPHPQAKDPVVIEDPLDVFNNVGRRSFRVQMVCNALAQGETMLKRSIARFDERAEDAVLQALFSNAPIAPPTPVSSTRTNSHEDA